MKISNEVKIGILAVVAIVLSIWGFNFIKGKDLLKKSNIYKVEYKDVTGLTKSAPVLLRGYRVGIVKDIYLNPQNPATVIAELDIDGKISIPKDTRAVLASGGLMSGQVIVLEFKNFCSGADCAQAGDFLTPRKMGMVESLLGVDLSTYSQDMKKQLPAILDTINQRFADPNNEAVLVSTLRDVKETTENLKSMTAKLDRLIAVSTNKFDNALTDVENITSNLKQSNGKINSILDNTNRLTQNLANTNLNAPLNKLEGTLSNIDGTLNQANGAIGRISTSLNSADQALGSVNALVGKINSGEGTLGRLITDDKMAKDIEQTLNGVGVLAKDINDKPYEYIPFKSRKRVLKYRKLDEKLEGK